MKISKSSIAILKNFSHIFESIFFNEPGVIITKSKFGQITAIYDCEEEFPNFGIGDLPMFLNVVNLFDLDKTEFNFKEKWVEIRQGKSKVNYIYTDMGLIKTFGNVKKSDKYKNFDQFDCTLSISEDELKKVKQASHIMFKSSVSKTKLQFDIKNGEGKMIIIKDDNTISNSFDIDVDNAQGSCSCEFVVDDLVMLTGNYDVFVVNKKMAKFQHKDIPLLYFVTSMA